MRILLVAYEFPPSSSPSSLRWQHLARELARQGHHVEVLAPRLPGVSTWTDDAGEQLVVHRTFAGPIIGSIEWIARWRRRATRVAASRARAGAPEAMAAGAAAGIIGLVKRMAGLFLYPDVRGEWSAWAERAFRRLIRERRFDVVVCAHEPAVSLRIGCLAARHGVPWVADLGDPVLAAYTPRQWRRRAKALESAVCSSAALIVVTTESLREELQERHGVAPERLAVVTQGFDEDAIMAARQVARRPAHASGGPLELFYAGRFYPFRRADALASAVAAVEGVRLTIASPELPPVLARHVHEYPDRFRYLGELPHMQVLEMQQLADVLVSIGNDGMRTQIPGKIYEYLGCGRPILHLRSTDGEGDLAAVVVRRFHAGSVVDNRESDIVVELRRLGNARKSGLMSLEAPRVREEASRFSWRRLAVRYSELLEQARLEAGSEDGRLGTRGARACTEPVSKLVTKEQSNE